MIQRDERYKLVKPMIRLGTAKFFSDIFIAVPKSVVSADIGTKLERFNKLLHRLEKFTLEDLFTIGRHCDLSEKEILKMVLDEYLKNKEERAKKGTLPKENGGSGNGDHFKSDSQSLKK
jgi:hypothetical protein